MPKAKKVVKEWKPKVNKSFRNTVKNRNSQQYGIVSKFGTGWKPYIRPYFQVSDFDLAKCVGLDLHGDSTYLKIGAEVVDEARLDPPEPSLYSFTYSAFGAVLESMFTKRIDGEEEKREYRKVSLARLPGPLGDLYIQTDMRDIRWGTSPSAVGAIETEKDLDAARLAAVKLLLEHKFIRLQPEDYALAEELGIQEKVAAGIAEIEI